MRVWIPSPPQRVIGPVAYYPLEGGGVMKEPPPSLVVAGLTNVLCAETSENHEQFSLAGDSCIEQFLDWAQTLTRSPNSHVQRNVICLAHNFKGYDSYFIWNSGVAEELGRGG